MSVTKQHRARGVCTMQKGKKIWKMYVRTNCSVSQTFVCIFFLQIHFPSFISTLLFNIIFCYNLQNNTCENPMYQYV